MEKQREKFQDPSYSLVNATDLHDWFHSPQTENPLSVPLMFLMVLFSSKRPIKAYKITGYNFYIFQSHNILTKNAAGHFNFIFPLREAIMPGTGADVTVNLSGWAATFFLLNIVSGMWDSLLVATVGKVGMLLVWRGITVM